MSERLDELMYERCEYKGVGTFSNEAGARIVAVARGANVVEPILFREHVSNDEIHFDSFTCTLFYCATLPKELGP